MKFPARTRIQVAATQNGWTIGTTFMTAPSSACDVFERPGVDGTVDMITVSFHNGRFSEGTRRNGAPQAASSNETSEEFWGRRNQGRIAVFEHGGTPKGRVERMIAAFA